jgi:hypothetical protein
MWRRPPERLHQSKAQSVELGGLIAVVAARLDLQAGALCKSGVMGPAKRTVASGESINDVTARGAASGDESYSDAVLAGHPGWWTRFWRGVLAGLSIVALALVILSVPVMLAWIVPGSDSVSAASALRAAALALLSGLHGGVVLGGQLATIAPLTVTVLLGWLVCGPARRLDSHSGFAGLIVGFGGASTLLARWSSLGETYAPLARTAVSATLFMIVIGAGARWAPQLCQHGRFRGVLRASAAVLATYALLGALLVSALLLAHHRAVTGLQAEVAPGAGGLAILLLGVGAAPNAVIAAIGYLTGFGFKVGSATSVAPLGSRRGPLPDLPLLGAVPHAGGHSVIGLILVALGALITGTAVVTALKPAGRSGIGDIVATAAVSGAGLALVGALARGGIGNAGLRAIGVQAWQIAVGGGSCVLAGSLVCALAQLIMRSLRPRTAATPLRLLSTAVDDGVVDDAVVAEPVVTLVSAGDPAVADPDADEVAGPVSETG